MEDFRNFIAKLIIPKPIAQSLLTIRKKELLEVHWRNEHVLNTSNRHAEILPFPLALIRIKQELKQRSCRDNM